MTDVAIVYWSDTGNTEAMAKYIAEGVNASGKTAQIIRAEAFSKESLNDYSAVAFGCPAMGDEVLEEDVFEPMFASLEEDLKGRRIAIFGSYGWGDGQWMREWKERVEKDGADLVDSIMANEYPDDEAIEQCRTLGGRLAAR